MRFEFMTYLKNKIYVGITLAVVILLAIGLSVPSIISVIKETGVDFSDEKELRLEDTVYIVDQTGKAPDLTWFSQGIEDNLWQIAEENEADEIREKIDRQEAGGLLLIESPFDYTLTIRRAGMTQGFLTAQVQTMLGQYFRSVRLNEQGLDEQTIREVLQEPELTVVETVEESGKSMEQAYFYTYLLLFLLYLTVMLYGQQVATSIASEKSNRAMEMLITSARPMNLMFGKVIGSGLAGLAQISVLLATAAVFFRLNQNHLESISVINSIFNMTPQIIFFTVLFYLIGYFIYAFLYGALGSLASRTEDINTSIMPIIMVFMVAFFVSVLGLMSPDAGWLVVASFIPLVSPMTMFVRISMTDVPVWQIIVSIILMLATIWATGWLSAKIYRIGILMYGKPPRLKELSVMLRNAK
jgi:ABC-2 type transport system permease protein